MSLRKVPVAREERPRGARNCVRRQGARVGIWSENQGLVFLGLTPSWGEESKDAGDRREDDELRGEGACTGNDNGDDDVDDDPDDDPDGGDGNDDGDKG